jgi:membrane protease subunit (stomatin/prohibitin family)
MGFIRKQLLKVIEYSDNRHDTICYKYPMDDRVEIMNGSTLTVREGQVAIFVKDGRIADVFAPGRYKLETKNLPFLTTLMNWNKGFNSPFKCDVYFVSTVQYGGQKWGTSNPFTMRDADFGTIRVRGFGTYAFKVTDAKLLMLELLGSKRELTTEALKDYFRSLITSNITDVIADSKFSAIDLASKLTEFNEIAKVSLQGKFEAMGLSLVNMVVENISFPEEVEKAIDKRAAVGIMGDVMGSHVAMEQAAAMRDAAKNPGMAGTMFGMGMMGNMAGGMMAGNSAMNTAQDSNKKFCTSCGAAIKGGAKFCPECGVKQGGGSACPKCGNAVKPGAKFCPECGNKM